MANRVGLVYQGDATDAEFAVAVRKFKRLPAAMKGGTREMTVREFLNLPERAVTPTASVRRGNSGRPRARTARGRRSRSPGRLSEDPDPELKPGPQALAEAQRILDAYAKRLLAEKLEREAA